MDRSFALRLAVAVLIAALIAVVLWATGGTEIEVTTTPTVTTTTTVTTFVTP